MPRRYYLLLTLITLVGAFLRLWQLAAVPPGLHYDLAATALLGNDVAFNGYRPVFISAYTGHEALYYYWLALWFRLVGSSVFTLRLAAAMLGVLAIPATFFAAREVLRFEKELSLSLAALAATFLALSFSALIFSRYGFRVISEPLVQALALGFLFKGLWKAGEERNTKHEGSSIFVLRRLPSTLSGGSSFVLRHRPEIYLILAGVFTGLAAYTYLAARLFPVPLAIFWLVVIVAAIRRGRSRPGAARAALAGFLLFGLAALVTFAPLGLYFLHHPQDFLNRAAQVAPRPGETSLLVTGLRRAAEMLFINGDPYDRFNIPGQPLFGLPLGFFFVIGLLVTLRNALLPASGHRRGTVGFLPPSRSCIGKIEGRGAGGLGPPVLQRAAEILLLVWLPVMLLPTALAVHDTFPSNMRASGLIPLLFIFPARGLLASYRWVQKRMPGPIIPYAYPLAVVTLAALALGAYSAAQDYFNVWAVLPNQRENNDADLTDIAAYLNARDTSQSSVYVSAIHYRHPTLAYLAHDYNQLLWLTGGSALVVPAGGPALYLFPRSAPPPEEWLAGWDPHLAAAPLDADGVPAYRAYAFAAGEAPPLPAFAPLDANFGNFATLTGYNVITYSDEVQLDLRWHIENLPAAGDFLPYARLTDAWGSGWSQDSPFTYPSEQWQPGDTLLTRLHLPLPAGLPPGVYTLTVGLYSAGANVNLPHLDSTGAFAGERAPVTTLTLPGGPSLTGSLAATRAEFRQTNNILPADRSEICILPGDNGQLLGYTIERSALRQGEWMHLSLYWANDFTIGDNALTITLGSQTLYTGQPVHGTYPFSQWAVPQFLIDRYALKVPADAPPGPTPLSVSVRGGRGGPCQAPLGTVTVSAVDRIVTAPPVAVIPTPPMSTLGEAVMLYGYTLTPGHPTTLSLAWKSLAPLDQDYTVFVHILDASGQIAAQTDSEPRAGTYPTSMWQPGEYVTDDYHFDLPPGHYTVDVGLYLPENGARLTLAGDAGDRLTLPGFDAP